MLHLCPVHLFQISSYFQDADLSEGKRDLNFVLLRKDAHKLRKNGFEDDMCDD